MFGACSASSLEWNSCTGFFSAGLPSTMMGSGSGTSYRATDSAMCCTSSNGRGGSNSDSLMGMRAAVSASALRPLLRNPPVTEVSQACGPSPCRIFPTPSGPLMLLAFRRLRTTSGVGAIVAVDNSCYVSPLGRTHPAAITYPPRLFIWPLHPFNSNKPTSGPAHRSTSVRRSRAARAIRWELSGARCREKFRLFQESFSGVDMGTDSASPALADAAAPFAFPFVGSVGASGFLSPSPTR